MEWIEPKNLIIEFQENNRGNYEIEIAPEIVPKFMKYIERWTISEDFKIEWRIK
jgi:hypothetical protein